MENLAEYTEFLGDSAFIKWGCIISKLVWGKSLREIGEAFGVSKPYVSKVCNKFLQDKQVIDGRINNGGHNKILKTPQKTRIQEILQETRLSTARTIANQLSDEMEMEISTSTVRSTMKEIGYQCNKPFSIPYLTDSAKEKRLDYCIEHETDNFSNVCFLDESCFQLCENRQLVWWCPQYEERPTIEYTSDRSKVMVCGGISRKGITDLYFWKLSENGGVDAEDYAECSDEILLKRMDGLYGYGKWRMLHDNAKIHTCYLTTDYLEANDVRIITHPPYSPDLNPIEKVWAYLKKKK